MKHSQVLAMTLVTLVLSLLLAPTSLADKGENARIRHTKEPGAVCGVVYQDWDQDGERDEQEPGLGGALVSLVRLDGSVAAEIETEIDGVFHFGDCAPGAYILTEADPLGFSSSTDNEITLVVRAGDVSEAGFGDMLLLGGSAPSPESRDSSLPLESATR